MISKFDTLNNYTTALYTPLSDVTGVVSCNPNRRKTLVINFQRYIKNDVYISTD